MPKKRIDATRPRGLLGRKTGARQPQSVILIVCEGSKTEPLYFKDFPVPKDIRDIHGLGMDPLRLVQAARKLQREYRQKNGYDYGQIWCVFDRDEFPLDRFNQALLLARQSGFQVAYSNPSFEFWYLLHFGFSDRPMTRHACASDLGTQLGCTYEKNLRLYKQMKPNQDDAIANAIKLLARYPSPDPANDNPSTTVHLLVQELNKHARP